MTICVTQKFENVSQTLSHSGIQGCNIKNEKNKQKILLCVEIVKIG